MKLIVGDPHCKHSELIEMNLLMDSVEKEALRAEVDSIILLGDLFDSHNLLRLEVIDFWQKRLAKLALIKPVIALVGNHDQKGNVEEEWKLSSLTTLSNIPNLTVVNEPLIIGNWAYVPYTQNKELFISTANNLAKTAKILVCHQTFDGSVYDNGMYAPDGIDPTLIVGYDKIISGHIHKFQEFSNIIYVGTPRWMSISDANQDKGIWLTDGKDFKMVSLGGVLSKVVQIELTEESTEEPVFDKKDKNYLILKGNSQWITKTAKKYKGFARIVPKPTDVRLQALSEKSKSSNFSEYLQAYLKEKNKKVDFTQVLVYIESI